MLNGIGELVQGHVQVRDSQVRFVESTVIIAQHVAKTLVGFRQGLHVEMGKQAVDPLLGVFFLVDVNVVQNDVQQRIQFILLVHDQLFEYLLGLFHVFLLYQQVGLQESEFTVGRVVDELHHHLGFFFFS